MQGVGWRADEPGGDRPGGPAAAAVVAVRRGVGVIGSPVHVPGATIDPPERERSLGLVLDARRAYRGGPSAIAERQRARLAALVDYARTRSPFYRQLYAGLPERVDDPSLLPVTDKAALMDRFDDWVTDPGVTRDQVQAFVADPALIGQPLLGAHASYAVATTSGTTGTRGLFLVDSRAARSCPTAAVKGGCTSTPTGRSSNPSTPSTGPPRPDSNRTPC